MAHDHGHGHGHSHSHAPGSFGRAFAIGITLNTVYVLFEIVFGTRAHSLALIGDAVHNASDVVGLALAWGASLLALRPPTVSRTYGWRRSTILSALVNAVFLLATMGGIAWESIHRLFSPTAVGGGTVLWVALLGIAVNAVSAFFFLAGRKGDLNVRGAFLHLASDAVLTAGVAIAGVVILFTGWNIIDPLVSLALVAVILYETWGLLTESINLSLDAVPEGIDAEAVRGYLAGIPGVAEVHDLHIWAMSTTEPALTAHLVVPTRPPHDALIAEACEELHEHFGIEHTTLQIESGDPAYPCALAEASAV